MDHTYQRDTISESRVEAIKNNWSWPGCGCLVVARREDGKLYVIDGQHRLLAARQLPDIQSLPCLLFAMSDLREESRAFVDNNTVRGAVPVFQRFKARVEAQDAAALRVAACLDDIGYEVGKMGNKRSISCIEAVESAFHKDPESATTALKLCALLFDGEPITRDVFGGLFHLDTFLKPKFGQGIMRPDVVKKLQSTGVAAIRHNISQTMTYLGKGNNKIYAGGIAKAINNKKHSNKIPSPLSD